MSARATTAAISISAEVLTKICQQVGAMCGNQFDIRQYPMVENRLKARMAKLQIAEGDDYFAFLQANLASEGEQLLSLLTTHHTYFFREFAHFEFLFANALPQLIAKARSRSDKKIWIWSAACSFGQEVYSLAMFFEYHLRQLAPDVGFEIWGTDVDSQSIKIAENGVYRYEDLKASPANYLGTNWIRGTAEIQEFAKVKQNIRDHCNFTVQNLVKKEAPVSGKHFDIIFCRNVFIYFSPEQMLETTRFLIERLEDDGFLFVGISESLTYLPLEIEHAGPSVYRKRLGADTNNALLKLVEAKKLAPKSEPLTSPHAARVAPAAIVSSKVGERLRVLCVDDSPSILTLLKRILAEQEGFEVVATAKDGKEAIAKLKEHQVDVMTLDIHMPNMDGLEYLQSQMHPDHPPIVMLSTVHRDHADLALRSLKLGASDYVEKPNIANLEDRGDQIRAKLKMAVYTRRVAKRTSVDKLFKREYKITNPEGKLRAVVASMRSFGDIETVVAQQSEFSPPLLIFYEGITELAGTIAANLRRVTQQQIQLGVNRGLLKAGQIYLVNLESDLQAARDLVSKRPASLMVCGTLSKKGRQILEGHQLQIVLQDLGEGNRGVYGELISRASQIAPITSFVTLSEEFLK